VWSSDCFPLCMEFRTSNVGKGCLYDRGRGALYVLVLLVWPLLRTFFCLSACLSGVLRALSSSLGEGQVPTVLKHRPVRVA
jgi:hypothetical protein